MDIDGKGKDMASENKMKIAIIGGTGDLGSGLAMRWARAGHEVIIGSRAGERPSLRRRSLLKRLVSLSPVWKTPQRQNRRNWWV